MIITDNGMYMNRLRIKFSDILLVLVHIATACMLFTLVISRSSHPVVLDRYSASLAAAIVFIFVLLLVSGFILGLKRKAYRQFLTTLILRFGVFPELMVIFICLAAMFLLIVGTALTPLLREPLFALGLSLLLASVALIIPVLMSTERRKAFAGRMGGFFIGLLVSLIAAELFLHIVLPSSIYHPSLDLRPNLKFEILNNVPGVANTGYHSTNSIGLRGEEPPEEWDEYFTIITVGGSTTHCFYLDDQKTWPYHLQENLRAWNDRIWVGNGGLIGHTTRGHIIFMREVIPQLNPDMVIVLCGINDLGLSLKPNISREGVPWEQASIGDRILASSRLIQVLSRWKRILFEDAIVITENLPRSYSYTTLDSPEIPLPPDLRTILPSLPEYESNIRTIIHQAREADVRIVFLTQPLMFEDNEYWRGMWGKPHWFGASGMVYSASALWRMLDMFNTELKQICRDEGVPCFDLAAALGHDNVFFVDEMHFSEAGAAEVSNLVSEFLIEQNIVQTK